MINKYILPAFYIIVILLIAYMMLSSNSNGVSIKTSISKGCIETSSPYIEHKLDKKRKISYCNLGDKDITILQSDYFEVNTKYISFEFIGYPQNNGISIYIEDNNSKKFLPNKIYNSGERWSKIYIELPNYIGNKVKIVAEDNSDKVFGWVGIGDIKVLDNIPNEEYLIYIKTFAYIFVFSFFISILFSYYLNNNDMLDSFVYMSITVGLISLFTFYTFLVSTYLGKALVFLIFLFFLKMLFDLKKENYRVTFLIFTFLFSMMSIILFLSYSNEYHIENFQNLSATKWRDLPIDNWIPKIFSDFILNENIPSPMIGDWLSSDRPPLQTGLFLLFSVISNSDLAYLVISVGVQLLVIVFITLMLLKYIDSKIFIYLAVMLIFFNGFTFVNALFVWPKLFSTLYQAIAFYYLYQIWLSKNITKQYLIMFGITAILAFLSHGGSIFYLLALSTLLVIFIKTKEDIKIVFYGLLSAIILYIPWLLYQKLVDPPGDRLLKWHLADIVKITDQTFVEVLVNVYSKLSINEWLYLKILQLKIIFTSFYLDILSLFSKDSHEIMNKIFFNLDYSFLFFTSFLAILFLFIKEWDKKNKLLTQLLLGSYFIYIAFWSLILMSDAVIHHGSYFGWFSGLIGISLIVFYFNKYLFYLLTFLNLFIFFKLYVVEFLFDKSYISSLIFVFMIFVFMLTIFEIINNKNLSKGKNDC